MTIEQQPMVQDAQEASAKKIRPSDNEHAMRANVLRIGARLAALSYTDGLPCNIDEVEHQKLSFTVDRFFSHTVGGPSLIPSLGMWCYLFGAHQILWI
jgi:hypothetical protein